MVAPMFTGEEIGETGRAELDPLITIYCIVCPFNCLDFEAIRGNLDAI